MAQRKKTSARPQRQHQQSQPSRHDKRRRLGQANPDQWHTTRAKFPLVGWLAAAVVKMVGVLDARMSFRRAILVAGMLLADGEFVVRRGVEVAREHKTFLATSSLVTGLIRTGESGIQQCHSSDVIRLNDECHSSP